MWRAGLGLLLLYCGIALADTTPLQGARIVEQADGSTVVEFAFAEDVRSTAHDVKSDSIEIRLRGATLSAQWNQEDEHYDGELGAVEHLTFDGSGAGGYHLAIRLSWPMSIELLPQPDARHLAIRLTDPKPPRHNEMAQAEVPPDSAGSALAVTAEPSSAPQLDAPTAVDPDALESISDPYQRALAGARQAAMSQDYQRAIALYTKAAQSSDVAVRQEALEMLAMARERNHQDAQAKLIYEQFLAQYPDSESTPRIRQRLSGLLTRDLPVQKKLKQPDPGQASWIAVGNISQFYLRNELAVNGDKAIVGVDGLFTNADVIVARRTQSLELGMRMSTNGLYDMSSDADSTYQLSTAYLEGKQIDWGVEVRIGRQSQQNSGVLGRYDGAQIRYQLSPWLKVGAIGGYALDYGSSAFTTKRPLYGVNAEIILADGLWDFAPFYIEQRADGLLDRRAVGLETRYVRDRISAFSLIDYDTYHSALNTTYLMVNLRLAEGSTAYVNVDRRRSPYITTENALIGQGVASLSDLEGTYTDQQIQQLADDRTATLSLATIGFDQEFSPRLQVGTDISYSDYAETQASGNVAATPSRKDYYYTLRFRSDDIFGSQTFSALYLRYADSPESQTSSIYWNNRFTFRNVWQLYPRIRVDYREFTDMGGSQWTVAPSLRLDYRPTRNMYFEFEAGYDRTQRDAPVQTQALDIVGYYCRLGYRSLF